VLLIAFWTLRKIKVLEKVPIAVRTDLDSKKTGVLIVIP
jgi:hypothetical protein